jgi:hypothetical protein
VNHFQTPRLQALLLLQPQQARALQLQAQQFNPQPQRCPLSTPKPIKVKLNGYGVTFRTAIQRFLEGIPIQPDLTGYISQHSGVANILILIVICHEKSNLHFLTLSKILGYLK